uniref:Uncharacterized protein n=1 Tax=Odontella aurita TaxID=265563 RepID=A0A7S4J7G6_9STRA
MTEVKHRNAIFWMNIRRSLHHDTHDATVINPIFSCVIETNGGRATAIRYDNDTAKQGRDSPYHISFACSGFEGLVLAIGRSSRVFELQQTSPERSNQEP